MRSICTCLFFTAFALVSKAQTPNWPEMMQDPNGNIYQIQQKFYTYWETHDASEKGKGFKAFKRWEHFTERRVYPSGDLWQLNLTAKNYTEWLDKNVNNIYRPQSATGKLSTPSAMIASTTWTPIGPMGPISGSAGGQFLKAGRICFISICPTNSNVLFVGAPAGGLWKSTNGGANWTTVTDNFPVTGFSDLAFDPTNTNILYAATGDGDHGDTYSNGVYKSTDGGVTWNITGLTFAVSSGVRIRQMIVNPSNSQIVIAVASNGVWRTTNGGTTWTQYLNGTGLYDVEFMPGNPNTVYCCGTTFRVSTDGGITWTQISNGIPTTGCNRMAIAVSPNNANYVWVVAGSSANSGMLGIYKSTNSGTAFTQMTTTLNLLGYNTAGNDVGGQSWYDLCIASNPNNVNEVVVGGVNVWRTTDGAVTWSLYGHWTGSGAPFTHADQHDLEYEAGGTLFNTNDGTVYRRTATAWQEISGTMNISQIYKIGLSTLTNNLWITGHQDNGTSTWNGTTYTARMGGDGMDCFIDRTNDNNMFAEYYNGNFQKSTNGGLSWNACQTGLTGTAPWVTIWKQDPQNASKLWAGRQDMFISTNLATSWSSVTALPATGNIVEFAVCKSNAQVVYVVKSNNIFRTQDGGTTWATITGTIPVGSAGLQNLVVSPTNTANIWVVSGNYSAGNKVWYSTNGGTTWTNWSANLPNIPGNCLFYEPGSNDRIYVGMDVGVYYRDPSQANWTLYNTGLPNTPLADMETSPAFPNKIVAATFGRGVWMVDFAPSNLPPVTSFAYSGTLCAGIPTTFNDNSTNGPTSWSWSVTPSAGVTINTNASQTPTITFANSGNYTVAMTASNSNGPGNTSTVAVFVNPTPTVTIASSANTVCAGSSVTFTASGASTYAWACPASSVCTYTPASTTNYTFTGTSAAGCSGVGLKNIIVQPSITVNASSSSATICAPSSATLTASGATTYTWQPGNLSGSSVVVSPAANTTYTVTGTSGVCNNSGMVSITVGSNIAVSAVSSTNTICAAQPVTLTASGATTYTWQPGNLNGSSVVVNPNSSTTYSVSGNTGSCGGNTIVAITVNQNPNVSATSSNTMICAGTAATLTAFGASSYSWSTGPTTQTLVVFPVLSTTYAVTGYSNGCSTTFTMVQNVAWCTTLAEFNLGANGYKAFPNPFADEIKFTANETIEVTMYDAQGKIVKQAKFKDSGTIHTSDLAHGVYVVFIKGESGIKTLRLLKDKN